MIRYLSYSVVFAFILLLGSYLRHSYAPNDILFLAKPSSKMQKKPDSMIKAIVHLPDRRLRVKTQLINFKDFKDKALQALIQDMFETMYAAGGVGLAAPQIGLDYRIAVIDVKADRSEQWVLINPEILWESEKVERVEGCLSIPGEYDRVPRAAQIKLKAWNVQGEPYEIEADGLLAHCIQHEIDHLNGTLYIDKLHPLAIIPHYQAISSALNQDNDFNLRENLLWITEDIQRLFSGFNKALQQKLMPFKRSLQAALKPKHPDIKKAVELHKIFHQLLLALNHRNQDDGSQVLLRFNDKLLAQCKDDTSSICNKLSEIITKMSIPSSARNQ